MLVLGLAMWIEQQRRKRVEKPPQTEKLLRPPGHSLSLLLDQTIESILTNAWVTSLCGTICGGSLKITLDLSGTSTPGGWILLSLLILLLSAAGTGWFAIRTFRQFHKTRNIKLGLRGEQAVAESLNEAAVCGFRSFHDLPAGDNWNIDHVAVGTRGIFLIETKTRRRRGCRNGQGEHIVRYDGKTLSFPFGNDPKPINQARRNAEWLSKHLGKKTGEPVPVMPVVVLPGWFVEKPKGNLSVEVMNARYLIGFLQRQNETINPMQLKRIVTALDEKCRAWNSRNHRRQKPRHATPIQVLKPGGPIGSKTKKLKLTPQHGNHPNSGQEIITNHPNLSRNQGRSSNPMTKKYDHHASESKQRTKECNPTPKKTKRQPRHRT